LRAHALGAPLEADAAAHLAVCSRCQAVLEGEARVIAMLDGALDAVASVTPGLDFQSRVRARVEHAPRWTPSGLRMATAAAAVALLAIAALFVSRPPRERPVARESPASRPIEQPVRPSVPPAGAGNLVLRPIRPKAKQVPRLARAEGPRAAGPEVLVPVEQREKVGRLFESLRAGRPEVISMLMRLQAGESVAPPSLLTIAPLRIEPVVVTTLPPVGAILDR
jgi:hypothetical protein